jgi:hypothetical protein
MSTSTTWCTHQDTCQRPATKRPPLSLPVRDPHPPFGPTPPPVGLPPLPGGEGSNLLPPGVGGTPLAGSVRRRRTDEGPRTVTLLADEPYRVPVSPSPGSPRAMLPVEEGFRSTTPRHAGVNDHAMPEPHTTAVGGAGIECLGPGAPQSCFTTASELPRSGSSSGNATRTLLPTYGSSHITTRRWGIRSGGFGAFRRREPSGRPQHNLHLGGSLRQRHCGKERARAVNARQGHRDRRQCSCPVQPC